MYIIIIQYNYVIRTISLGELHQIISPQTSLRSDHLSKHSLTAKLGLIPWGTCRWNPSHPKPLKGFIDANHVRMIQGLEDSHLHEHLWQSKGKVLGKSLWLVGNDHRIGNEAMSIIYRIYWDSCPISPTNTCWITTSLLKTNSNFRKEEWAYLDRSCTLCLFTLVSCVCPSLLQSGKSQTVAIGKYLHLTSRRQAYPPHLSKPTTEHLSKTWISWTRERSCNWRLSYAGPVELMAISQSAVLAINFDRCHY